MAAAFLLAPWPAVRGQDGAPKLNGPGQQADAGRMAAYEAEGGVPEDASLEDGWLGGSVLRQRVG